MATVARCLTDSVLAALSDGKLPSAERLAAARHLRHCPDCQARARSRSHRTTSDGVTPGDSDPETLPVPAVPESVGPYRIVRLIGRGGMGTVYEAVHERMGRTVALKVLAQMAARDSRYLERFHREARTVSKLHHPNVVKAIDAGEADGVPYLAMELVDGVDVARMVRNIGPLPVSDAAEIVRRAATGLAHAHAKGIIHRDVKPSNLMVTAAGEVKILDLGLALSLESVSLPVEHGKSAQVGTHDFMAPEQWADASTVGPPADVYGLGCVLYQALAGRPPFVGLKYSTPKAKEQAHRHSPLPPLPDRPDLPPALVAIVERMLAKHPDQRPTAEEVAAEMTPFVGIVQLPRLVECARHAPTQGFVEGEPTNPAPLVPDSGSHRGSSVLPTMKSSSTQESPVLPDPEPRAPRWPLVALGAMTLAGCGVLVWALARWLRGTP